MPFYVEPLGLPLQNHPIDREIAGGDYHPTSVSVVPYKGRRLHNVRFVNYIIDRRNGSYTMKEGTYFLTRGSHAERPVGRRAGTSPG
jgi:hypothetical protein